MGHWTILLLVPFLVIGVGALVAGVIALRARRRSMRRMPVEPPQPEHEWQGPRVAPLLERPVERPGEPDRRRG